MSEFPELKAKQEELAAGQREMARFFEQAGGTANMDLSRVDMVKGTTAEKIEWVNKKNAELEALGKEVTSLKAFHAAAANAASNEDLHMQSEEASVKSFGEAFTRSDLYKKAVAGDRSSRWHEVNTKALFERTAGFEPEVTRSGLLVPYATRQAPDVLSHIAQKPWSQSAYRYMQQTVFTNTAAEVAEGGLYPDAAIEWAEVTVPVEKFAVSIAATDEQLADESHARSLVDQDLMLMLRQRLDSQVLSGNGTAPNIRGTLNVSGINTKASSKATMIDDSLELFTTIEQTAFTSPSIMFMNPADWNAVAVLKDLNDNYIWHHPMSNGPKALWGVTVHTTPVVASGTAITGDYQQYGFLVARAGLEVQATDSHDDFFLKGKLAIRAQLRCAMVHTRAAAFGTLTGINV